MSQLVTSLRNWPARRWWFAALMAIGTFAVVAIPTDLIPNPVFGRDVPPTSWAVPVLIASSVLAGLLGATYVASPDAAPRPRESRLGIVGAMATYFAVGCPVCNKLVLLALGYTGALQYFAPFQIYLALGSVALLGWAFVARVRREDSCALPPSVGARTTMLPSRQ